MQLMMLAKSCEHWFQTILPWKQGLVFLHLHLSRKERMEGGLLGRMRKGAAALSEIYDASSVRQEKQTSFKQIRQLSENRALQNLMFDVFPV